MWNLVFSYRSAVMDAGPWMVAGFDLLSFELQSSCTGSHTDLTYGYTVIQPLVQFKGKECMQMCLGLATTALNMRSII